MNTMKTTNAVRKVLSCMLMLAMLVALTACGDNPSEPDKNDISGIVGTWNEVSVFPRVLTVHEDSTYTLDEEGGKVTVDYEEHPDGSKSVWYTFTTNEGEFWTSFAKDEDNEVQNDLWSGQDGEMHFMRDGIDEQLTTDDYLHHAWSSGRCYITFEKDKKNYVASVSWSNSASESTQWTYICRFDEKTSSMVCEKGATCVVVTTSKSGKQKSKTVYKDGSGSFLIKSGTLRWIDDKENAGADMYFVKLNDAE